MMKKQFIRILLFAIPLSLIVAGTSCKKGLSIEWTTAKIEKGDVNVNVTATGTLGAVTTVQVGTQVSGIINKINVDFNSKVKKGQIVAEIDKTPLIAALEDVRASLAKAHSTVTQTSRDYARMKKLLDVKAIAQSDYDASLSNYEVAVAIEKSARAQLDRAQINLAYATIYAPINGVVISRAVDVGQTVAASFSTPTLFTIANDLTKMQVLASVDEADIGQVKLAQEVSFTVDAYQAETFKGTVTQIRLQPTTVQNVVTYTVVIDVPNKDLKLMPGMTANITVHVEDHPAVLKVQTKALRFMPPAEYYTINKLTPPDSTKNKPVNGPNYFLPGTRQKIWMKDKDNKLRSLEVTLGISDGNYTEVRGDIKEGDEVVLESEVKGKAGSGGIFSPPPRQKK